MSIHSERKAHEPVRPERCARCGAGPGTSWLDLMASAGAPLDGRRRVWLCSTCRAEVRRDAPGN